MIKNPFLALVGLALVMLVSFTATAHAATAVAPADGSWVDLLQPVIDAFRGGHYISAGALAVVVAVAAARKYATTIGPRFADFVHSDAGGAASTLITSFAGTIAATTASGDTWHWSMITTAGAIAFIAAGGYAAVKRLVVTPILASKWYSSAPSWVRVSLKYLGFWIFDERAAEEPATPTAPSTPHDN